MSVRSILFSYSIPMRQTKRSSELLPPNHRFSILGRVSPACLTGGGLSCLAGGCFRAGMGDRMKREERSTNRPIKTLDFLAVSLYNDFINGVIAQLVARLNGIQKVRGSTPLSSTNERIGSFAYPFVALTGSGEPLRVGQGTKCRRLAEGGPFRGFG